MSILFFFNLIFVHLREHFVSSFKHRAEQVGWKQAVRERDEGTFDWTANRPYGEDS